MGQFDCGRFAGWKTGIDGMATREHFTISIICPSCKNAGIATVSENDNPSSLDFRVERYPEGFSEATEGVQRMDIKIRCKCGEVFQP
jgi:hypothetical protein